MDTAPKNFREGWNVAGFSAKKQKDEKKRRVRELQNLSVSENGIDPNDTIAGLIRSKQNRNCVRWYVLTLPISRKGFYCGDPAKKLIAEMDRRTRNGEKTFEFFADRKSTRLNSSHANESRMPSSA